MKLVADIHLHSHYSRATSRNLTLEHLWKWAQIKGVQVVATGDIAHPGWLAELRDKLEPAEAGLFRLKPEHTEGLADQVPAVCRGTVRFLIGGEISNIYKKYDRTRKVHNIVFSPSFDATARLQEELEKIGNIRSDGRPILGLDSRDLLEIVLAVDDRCHLIPAHIWTPWFSILGSRSGFHSVQECYADLTPHIFAVETGLSSDPPMNWRVSWLDDYTLISSSDAHSPQKLAREATCFDTELSYDALFDALRGGDRRGYRGTVEFFPEEGKYHMDGHRKCGVCWEPATTRSHEGRCSVCGKPVTVGVYHRMEELADRPSGARPPAAGPFASLIPLPEALSEILGVGPNSKRVQREYHRLVERLGPELAILREVPLEDIDAAGGAILAEGIRRMRAGEVRAEGGYDGQYGAIRLFDGEADRSSVVQLGMFDEPFDAGPATATPAPPAGTRGKERRTQPETAKPPLAPTTTTEADVRATAASERDRGGGGTGASSGAGSIADAPAMQPRKDVLLGAEPRTGSPATRELPSAPKSPARSVPPASEPAARDSVAVPLPHSALEPPATQGPAPVQGSASREATPATPAPGAPAAPGTPDSPRPPAAPGSLAAPGPASAPKSPATTAPPVSEPPAPDPPSAAAAAVAMEPPERQPQPSGAGCAPAPEPPAVPARPAAAAAELHPRGAQAGPASAAEPRRLHGTETGMGQQALTTDPASKRPAVPSTPAPAGVPAAGTETGATRAPGGGPHTWLAGLNPAQRAAATHAGGPLAIVAGPGTGKTRTLTVRIAHLVRALAADPASILVLTFTHKAADELRERLAGLLPRHVADEISAGTFHQLGARLLEEFGAAAGVPRPFAIFDESDRRALLKQCFRTLSARQARDALAAISASKNGLPPASDESFRRPADAAARSARPNPPAPASARRTATASGAGAPPGPATLPGLPSLPDAATLRTRYDSALAEAGALDLDDLVARTVQMLDRATAVRRVLQQRYRWISVDEYQDVNAAQYRLLRLLAGGGANLCVIGDPDQAIYGFRGADHRFFLSFGADFPGAETLRLDRNYRSAQTILAAAGQVIAGNPGHQATRLTAADESVRSLRNRQHPHTAVGRTRGLSHAAAQVRLDVYRAPTDRAEAEYVVHQVERLIGGTSYFSLDSGRVEDDGAAEARSFADFAVLYRLNAQARLLEEAFDRSGIPYQTAGATPLAEQPPVREILALLWLTEAPASRLHWRRVLLEGAGAASEQDLTRFLAQLSAAGAGAEPVTPRTCSSRPQSTAATAGTGVEPPAPSRKPLDHADTGAAGRADAVANAAAPAEVGAVAGVGKAAAAPVAHGSAHGRAAAALHLVRKLTAGRRAPVAERVRAAAEGWAALRGRGYDDAEAERIARLQRRAAAVRAGMREFLTDTAMQSETDRYDERADRVALMSLHAAKGLEFPVVFIVGCEQGLLPYHPPDRAADPDADAEERRLFYVGMTRARRRLILSHAARRLLFGERRENRISGFVTDIETALRAAGQPSPRPRQPTAADLQLPLF